MEDKRKTKAEEERQEAEREAWNESRYLDEREQYNAWRGE